MPPAAPADVVDAVAAPAPKAAAVPVKGERPKVAVIPLRDQINDPMLYFIRRALKDAKAVIVPEHNIIGWLAKEIKSAIPNGGIVFDGPKVYGGMTLPVELIMTEIYNALGMDSETLQA